MGPSVKKTLITEVLKLGPRIAWLGSFRSEVLRLAFGPSESFSLRSPLQTGILSEVMCKAKSYRSIINLLTGASLFAAASGLATAQQVSLSLGSASAIRGKSVSLSLSLATSGGAQPTALQWTMAYPASAVSSVSVTPGGAAIAASKNVTCSSGTGRTTCIVFGVGDDTVGSGVLATATLNLAPGTAVASAPVQVASVAAISVPDSTIPSSGTGRLIAIRPASGSKGSAVATSRESSASSSAPASDATMFNP